MVFQRPNPLPISIRENVLFGHRLHQPNQARRPSQQQALLEDALRTVQLWDEVKDRLDQSPATLTLEQQQKLCIARLLPVKPRLLLMDEPCSTLDPQGTAAVEELIWQLRGKYTIFLVTHDMAQARRISEECIFMLAGQALEHQQTDSLFITPRCRETTDYIEGKYG
jgi:phosphate transport system ATP-binding protein